jgi:hypothetical protein
MHFALRDFANALRSLRLAFFLRKGRQGFAKKHKVRKLHNKLHQYSHFAAGSVWQQRSCSVPARGVARHQYRIASGSHRVIGDNRSRWEFRVENGGRGRPRSQRLALPHRLKSLPHTLSLPAASERCQSSRQCPASPHSRPRQRPTPQLGGCHRRRPCRRCKARRA